MILSCWWNQWGRGKRRKSRSTMTNTKDAVYILTFCSFFSDILSPCLANCQECAAGGKHKKKRVRGKNNTVHTADKDFYNAIVNEQSGLMVRQSSSIHSHQTTQTTRGSTFTGRRIKPHCTYWLSRHCHRSPSRPLWQPAGHLFSWRPASDQPGGSDWLPLSSQCPFPGKWMPAKLFPPAWTSSKPSLANHKVLPAHAFCDWLRPLS